jgi:Spy/CpxP family protein refolding chaperone
MRSLALRALSLGAALSVGATVVAQAPTRTQDQPPRRGAEQGAARRAGGGPLFRDITLTEAQRTRVREIQEKYVQERRQLLPQRPARQEGAERQRPDSAARAKLRAEREQVRARMQQLTDRQVADLRAVLTAEQQTTFDRNVTALKQRVSERGERGFRRGGFGRGGEERGPRGERGERGGDRTGGPRGHQHGPHGA